MSSEGIDYRVLGLKVGLEIHVQLNTRRKLFCPCPTRLSTNYSSELDRYLRPARSEVGEVDPAAMLEWSRKKKYRYLVSGEESCLVEADEEPPHFIDRESLLVALAIAKALNMKIVDEIHAMRKIVIDGSNVSGFQRTALIALNGHIRVDDKVIGVQTLCLEEDAARKVEESEVESVYVLDRLGIPLVEIATAPDIDTPELALRTALKIGQLVRLTGKAKWGLGTIRQDINVSIAGGAKTEIKGIQHLYMIPLAVEYEVKRQIELLRIRDELKARGLTPENIKPEVVDVTEVFENTSSKVLKRALEKGGVVLALVLPGFKGILSWSTQPGRRFGTELSDYAKAWGGVGGIFHTDELPGYGISESEVSKLYSATGADSSRDAIVIVADEEEKAKKALIAVAERAKYAIIGIPEETRAANPDGTTRYMRPRPGAARMYPETDIPPVLVTDDILEEASRYMPEHPDIKYKHLVEEHGLSGGLARALLNDLMLDFYEYLAEKYGDKVPCSVIASILVNTIPMLRREGVPVENLSEDAIEDVVKLVAEGVVAKEAVPDILAYMAKNPGVRAIDAVNALRVKKISANDLDDLIVNTIERLKTRLLEKRDKAFNIVMGEVMKTVRGSVDGKLVAERVKLKLKEVLGIE
ncbi:MAG: Glu-tRNA(Gln) amidotransferase subunit GatE [Desulfurococcaceae archaeon]